MKYLYYLQLSVVEYEEGHLLWKVELSRGSLALAEVRSILYVDRSSV